MSTGHEKEQSSIVELSPASPGSRIFGKFRLLANLGAGGMGEVFLALSRSSLGGVNKLVVIKRLRHFAEDEARSEAREMFLNEARLATLLNHPNIVQTNDVGVEDGHMFLTMEYLEGQPLNAIVRAAKAQGRKLDDAVVMKIISDALAGLHYAHELRDYDGKPLSIVHRDLSPHNLFVTYEGIAKVVDFGIAKTAVSAKTEQGIIKGKFAYMAPEQASDDKVDRRADVFVMGIVLWELLTGERLVFRRNDVQTVNRLLNDTFLPPSSVRADLDPELDALVMKALSRDPAARFQSAREMREALEQHLLARSHPVRQEEIGPLISELFSVERAQIRQRIQQCIATAQDDAVMDHLPALTSRPLDAASTPNASRPSLDGSGSLKPSPLSGTLAATMRGPDGDGDGSSAGTAAPPNKKGRMIVAAGVVAAAVIAVATYGAVGHGNASTAAVKESTPAATRAEPAAAAAPSPAADSANANAAPTTATATAPPAPAANEHASSDAPSTRHRWSGPSHAAPAGQGHAAAAAPPAASPAPAPTPPPAPAPPPTPTATTHARVFNTAL
jgi:serine/threonine protein kinase